MSLHSRQSVGDSTPAVSTKIQRACSCGAQAGLSGKCGSCAANEKLGTGSNVAISAPKPTIEPAPKIGESYRTELDELGVRVAALEALDRRAEAAIADMAATQFELQHVREELERLRAQLD